MAEYIEREKLMCKDCIHDGVCYMQQVINDIEQQIKEFGCDDFNSTVDVVDVVHGRWERLENDWIDLWRCTSCGADWTFEHDPTNADTKVNYCPHCGAKMDEGGNEDG